MPADYSAIYHALRNRPPACLSGAGVACVASPVYPGAGCNVVWRVGIPDCHDPCQVEGSTDPASGSRPFFCPVRLKARGRSVTIFDAGLHGYNAVLDAVEGGIHREPADPPDAERVVYACDGCGSDAFVVEVELEYLPGAIYAFSDPGNRSLPWSDMFDTYCVRGRCISCGCMCEIAVFEGL